jgi:LysM repeat protein
MTRETKIGLLVGLAFIIVIGILLSDHLTSSSEPAMAPLADAGDTARESINMLGTGEPPAQPVATPTITPQQPVMTHAEMNRPTPQPVQIVRIGAPSPGQPVQPQPAPIMIQPGQGDPQIIPTGIETGTVTETLGADPDMPVITRTGDPLTDAAGAQGELLVNADGSVRTITPAPAPQPAAFRAGEYVAQPGDSLSKMAGKLMGGNTKANRDAIIAANPSLKADPNKVIAGKTYNIPIPSTVAVNLNPAATALVPVAPVAEAPRQPVSSQPEYWYTVKENDSLWKIAETQLGDGNAYTAIKELNKETLKGSDVVTPNMKLRLPARPVASTND